MNQYIENDDDNDDDLSDCGPVISNKQVREATNIDRCNDMENHVFNSLVDLGNFQM